MLYFFYGSDIEKTRTKAFEWVAKARAKEPNLQYVRLAKEEITGGALEEAAHSGGLFVKRLLILIDDPFPSSRLKEDDDEGEEDMATSVIDEHMEALAASDNAIVILAPRLAATKAKKIISKAKVEYRFDTAGVREPVRGFNGNLVNALASRSREKLWLEINRALLAGDAPEMLHGLLHWKARDLMEKASGRSAWKPEEARSLSLALIELLQESRRGGLDLGLALERFALSV